MAANESLPSDFDEFVKLTNIAHWIYRVWTVAFIAVGIIGNLLALTIFIPWTNRSSVSELPPGRPARPSENMKFKSELIPLHYIEVEWETSSDQYY